MTDRSNIHRKRVEPARSDYPAGVVKAGLLTAGGFGTTLATILMVSGQWQIGENTTRFAIVSATTVLAIALFTVAIYLWRRV